MRLTISVLIGLVLCVGVAAAQHAIDREVRHSGTIVGVGPGGSAIVLEELVTWTGPGTGVVTRSIRLTPQTAIRLIQRAPLPDGVLPAMPGWDATTIEASSLREGDFATVTTNDERRGVAVALQVVRGNPVQAR